MKKDLISIMDYTKDEYLLIAVAFVASFVVSLVCMKGLVAYVRKHDFSIFGFYRIALAIVVTIYFISTGR